MCRFFLVLALPVLAAVFSTSRLEAQDGGIELLAAETLFAKGIRVSATSLYRIENDLFSGSSSVTDPLGMKYSEEVAVLGLDYGIRYDTTISLLVPLTSKEFRVFDGARHVRYRTEGFGDVAMLAKWRPWKTDWHRGSANAAIFGGIEMPTGQSRESKDGVRLPSRAQLGRGAWNPFFGGSVNADFDLFRVDYTLFYKLNQAGAADTKRGGFLSTEVDVAYRFWHESYPGASHSVKLGLQFSNQQHSRQSGSRDVNSGYDLLLLKPGMTFHFTPATTLKVGYDFPLYRDYDGRQLAFGQRFTFAFGIRF